MTMSQPIDRLNGVTRNAEHLNSKIDFQCYKEALATFNCNDKKNKGNQLMSTVTTNLKCAQA